MVSYLVIRLYQIIILILLTRILLSWFPNVNWQSEPFYSLRKFTDIFLEPFRKIIPPIGMIDISPIVAFIVLQILVSIIVYILEIFGL